VLNEIDWVEGVMVSGPGAIETAIVCWTDWTELSDEPVFPVVPVPVLPSAPLTGVLTPWAALSVLASSLVVEPPAPRGCALASVELTETLVGVPDDDSAACAIAPPRSKIGAVTATAVATADARARRDLFPVSPMRVSRQRGTRT
jgi:hypothetical protein